MTKVISFTVESRIGPADFELPIRLEGRFSLEIDEFEIQPDGSFVGRGSLAKYTTILSIQNRTSGRRRRKYWKVFQNCSWKLQHDQCGSTTIAITVE